MKEEDEKKEHTSGIGYSTIKTQAQLSFNIIINNKNIRIQALTRRNTQSENSLDSVKNDFINKFQH